MPVNATMRKALRKKHGDVIKVSLELDKAPLKLSAMLMACLKDEPEAKDYFMKLPGSHQQYYSKWIESAKTDATKTKRIALAITAFSQKMSFSQMMQLRKQQ